MCVSVWRGQKLASIFFYFHMQQQRQLISHRSSVSATSSSSATITTISLQYFCQRFYFWIFVGGVLVVVVVEWQSLRTHTPQRTNYNTKVPYDRANRATAHRWNWTEAIFFLLLFYCGTTNNLVQCGASFDMPDGIIVCFSRSLCTL